MTREPIRVWFAYGSWRVESPVTGKIHAHQDRRRIESLARSLARVADQHNPRPVEVDR